MLHPCQLGSGRCHMHSGMVQCTDRAWMQFACLCCCNKLASTHTMSVTTAEPSWFGIFLGSGLASAGAWRLAIMISHNSCMCFACSVLKLAWGRPADCNCVESMTRCRSEKSVVHARLIFCTVLPGLPIRCRVAYVHIIGFRQSSA